MDILKSPQCSSLYTHRQLRRNHLVPDLLSFLVAKGINHGNIVTLYVSIVKRQYKRNVCSRFTSFFYPLWLGSAGKLARSGTSRRTKDGFPSPTKTFGDDVPSPRAPLRNTPRIGKKCSGGNDADTQKPCPCLSPPRRRGPTRRDRTGFPPT